MQLGRPHPEWPESCLVQGAAYCTSLGAGLAGSVLLYTLFIILPLFPGLQDG